MIKDTTTITRKEEGVIEMTRVMTREIDNESLMNELSNIMREKESYLREIKNLKARYDAAVELEEDIKLTLAEVEGNKAKTNALLDEINSIVE